MSSRRRPVSPTRAIAVLSLIALLFVSCGSPEGNTAGTKPNKPTKPEQVDPVDLMNHEEEGLYYKVPFYDCVPIRAAARRQGAIAGLRCTDATRKNSAKNMKAVFFRFDTRAQAEALYNQRLAQVQSSAAEVTSEEGWCVTTSMYGWSPPCYVGDGRVVFYRKGSHVFVEWSAPKHIYGKVERLDSKMGKLSSMWWNQW